MFIKYINKIKSFFIKIYNDIKNFNYGKLKCLANINYSKNKNNLPKDNKELTVVNCKFKKVTIKKKN